ncbi:MAG: hypothetical protein EOM23_04535 [Candidatus Moranbacteria bacterium]|nr:hypothetical protein [Candidatus Moranbacteria bacterium]
MKKIFICLGILIAGFIVYMLLFWGLGPKDLRPKFSDLKMFEPRLRRTVTFEKPIDIYYIAKDRSLRKYSLQSGENTVVFSDSSSKICDYDKATGNILVYKKVGEDSLIASIIATSNSQNDTIMRIKLPVSRNFDYKACIFDEDKILHSVFYNTNIYSKDGSVREYDLHCREMNQERNKALFFNKNGEVFLFNDDEVRHVFTYANKYFHSFYYTPDTIVMVEQDRETRERSYKLYLPENDSIYEYHTDRFKSLEFRNLDGFYFLLNGDYSRIIGFPIIDSLPLVMVCVSGSNGKELNLGPVNFGYNFYLETDENGDIYMLYRNFVLNTFELLGEHKKSQRFKLKDFKRVASYRFSI